MMKWLGTLLLPLVLVAASFGQQQPAVSPADTARTSGVIILDPGLSTGKSSLLLPPSLRYQEFPEDTSIFAFWKKTAVRPPLLAGMLEPKADLTATLRAQWSKDSQLQTLRTVLGTVQLGGAAYLAYRALTAKGTPKPIKKK
jgi:hypothetical protein